jgi:hypothetical protein
LPTSLAQRITALQFAGVIPLALGRDLRTREVAMLRGTTSLADQLDVSVSDLVTKYSHFVICRARKHLYLDDETYLDKKTPEGGYIVWQPCKRCGAKSYHYYDADYIPQENLGMIWPPNYSFGNRTAGLTPRYWRPAASYIGLALRIFKLEHPELGESEIERADAILDGALEALSA